MKDKEVKEQDRLEDCITLFIQRLYPVRFKPAGITISASGLDRVED